MGPFGGHPGREQAGSDVQLGNQHSDGMRLSVDGVTQEECQLRERSKIIYNPKTVCFSCDCFSWKALEG